MKKIKLHMPHVYTLIMILIVLMAVLTWIVPSGQYERTVMDTAAGEREVVVAGTYSEVDKVTEDGDLRQGLSAILQAPAKGIQSAIEVIAFVFIVGGVFQILAKTNALHMGITSLIKRLGNKRVLIIPILMTLFSLGGSTFGMSDELVPFYILLMPILLEIGYDSMTTFMVVCLSASVGYAASTINPFNVLIAQGIAGIQGNPQLWFRVIQWAIVTGLCIAVTTIRAIRVQKNPELSITYKDDILKRKEFVSTSSDEKMTGRQKAVLVIFVLGMVLIVFGLIKYGWYMNELGMVFLGMGILMGIAGGLNEKEICEEFITGCKDITFAAILIGFCSGISVILSDGMIIDTILNAMATAVSGASNSLCIIVMYIIQSLASLLVPSSSGLAALTMPIMAPLCDLRGFNPEAAVTVLQYANQFTNIMSPVAGTTVAGLAICKISFPQWWKTAWKLFIVLTILGISFGIISAML